MATHSVGTVRRADGAADYQRFNVSKDVVAPREDGVRQDATRAGAFDWWYFEVRSQAAFIVVAFLTKPLDHQDVGLHPLVSVRIKTPDAMAGGNFQVTNFEADQNVCRVRADANSCECTAPGKYLLKLDVAGVRGTIELTALRPPARIGTGHLVFERDGREQYFGWVVPVPFGQAVVDLEVEGQRIQTRGIGYHDHNWGDQPMAGPIHHWYWGRAVLGDYVLIAANMAMKPSYGSVDHTDIVLMKGDQFICLGNRGASFEKDGVSDDPTTRKPVADVTTYCFVEGNTRYVATFTRQETALARPLDGAAYHRFRGECTLRIYSDDTVTFQKTEPTTWELMWFGDAADL